ncbi:MAG TPA: flavodoxin domain-containing protein, partial [Acidimicrobiia bacterium]|nr:flavodoxin domain-containing protein [Acidimicrobiia bacterium]
MDEPMDKAMGNRVLVVFHTSEGQTARIADRIGDVLRAAGDTVDVVAVDEAPDVSKYDAVVLGDSIHVGHYSHAFSRYVKANAVTLNAMPTALFQVSLVSANPDAEHAATAHTLVQKLLDDTGLDPDIVGMFAGAL